MYSQEILKTLNCKVKVNPHIVSDLALFKTRWTKHSKYFVFWPAVAFLCLRIVELCSAWNYSSNNKWWLSDLLFKYIYIYIYIYIFLWCHNGYPAKVHTVVTCSTKQSLKKVSPIMMRFFRHCRFFFYKRCNLRGSWWILSVNNPIFCTTPNLCLTFTIFLGFFSSF